jgi:alpha-galactosidase
VKYQRFNGLGCFNDMDMLIVGMHGKGNVGIGGCTDTEYKTHFSAWAMLNSPLMIGCDIREMSEETKAILTNKDIIAINQDPAGRQPYLISGNPNSDDYSEMQTWATHLEGGDIAIGIFNLSDHPADPFIPLDAIGLSRVSGKGVSVRDLWKKEELGVFTDTFRTDSMAPHGCRMYRFKVVDAK